MPARAGPSAQGDYLAGFVTHILDNHVDPASGLVRNAPGRDGCNIGYGIEFVDFALASLANDAPAELVTHLEAVLQAAFHAGFRPPGSCCRYRRQAVRSWTPRGQVGARNDQSGGHPVSYRQRPDLDPGYHTGISLLGAMRVAERLTR